jgi:hypothetical protein
MDTLKIEIFDYFMLMQERFKHLVVIFILLMFPIIVFSATHYKKNENVSSFSSEADKNDVVPKSIENEVTMEKLEIN